jgi:hypothetical protein
MSVNGKREWTAGIGTLCPLAACETPVSVMVELDSFPVYDLRVLFNLTNSQTVC